MQPALQENFEEISGVYQITPEGPVRVGRLHDFLPFAARRGRFSSYIESALVTVAVVGFMGLTAFVATAHYDGIRSAQPTAASLAP